MIRPKSFEPSARQRACEDWQQFGLTGHQSLPGAALFSCTRGGPVTENFVYQDVAATALLLPLLWVSAMLFIQIASTLRTELQFTPSFGDGFRWFPTKTTVF